jgi:hypothetical protein
MKTYKSFLLLNAVISVLGYSCTKDVQVKPAVKEGSFSVSSLQKRSSSETSDNNIALVNPSELGKDVRFYATKTVSLTTSLGISVGTLTIKRGSDRFIYFNYLLNAGWSFTDLNLSASPVNNPYVNKWQEGSGKVPFTTGMKLGKQVSEYNIVIKNLPVDAFSLFTAANIIYTYHGQAVYQTKASADGLFK